MLRFIIAVFGMIAVGWLVWRLLQQQEEDQLSGDEEHDDSASE